MTAWLNVILFLGFIVWVRLGIGTAAILAGGFNLREFFQNKQGTCKVAGSEKRRRVFERIRRITHEKQFWLAFVGIIILAFAVNLVELICSAGFPAVYTQVLAMSSLPSWQYYGYILLYIFFFLLDDLAVFAIAMVTLQAVGVTTKYARVSHLVGGFLMLALGILLILRPEFLMFG